MRLVLRVTVAIFLFITISSAAIGYFAISKYQSSQIHLIDASLNSKVNALKSSKEDPLTVAQYLAQVSSIPVTVEYLAQGGVTTELTEVGPSISKIPNAALIKQARSADISFGKDYRIRSFALPRNESLLFVTSLVAVNQDVLSLSKELIIFIIIVDLIACLFAFLFFRRDGKLNEVSHLIESQHRVMQKFLGDASHELRTPLTVIKGYVDLARSAPAGGKQVNYLEKSSTEIIRMESIIDDLLLLAEAGETHDEEVEAVDLSGILKEHVEVLRALQSKRVIDSNITAGITLNANMKLIERLTGNLFSNIRRHTPSDAPVSVWLKHLASEIILVVEDGGPGLEEYPDSPRLFKRFTSQRSKEDGGSGLGLSIINSVVERYHGSLTLSKSSLGGLRIEIKLPEDSLV